MEEIWPEWSKAREAATKTRLDFNHVQSATGISSYQIDKVNSVLRMIRRERLREGARLEKARYESELRRLRSLNRDTVVQFGRSEMGPALSASIEESLKRKMFSGYDDLVIREALQLVELDPLFVNDRLQADLLRSSLPEIESAFDAIHAKWAVRK